MALKIELVQRLDLGIQGEHNAHVIRIDCTGWLQQFPNGTVSLYHKRNGDNEMGVTGATFDRQTNILSWEITDYETYYSGEGVAEIRLTEGTATKKKKRAITLVRQCVVGEDGEPIQSTWQGFIDEVERIKSQVGSEAEAWAVGQRGGVDVDPDDHTYHNNSKYYAQNLDTIAQELIAEIEAAAEAAKEIFPEDISDLARQADVQAIMSRFNNGVLSVANGGTGVTSLAALKTALGVSNQSIVNLIYPVGSIYITAGSTNPQTIFGGTWERIKDSFLLAAGDTYAAAATGGAASQSYTPAGTIGGTAITEAQMPAHTHGFTPSGTVANHSHGFTPAGSIASSSSNLHSHTFTGIAHQHSIRGSESTGNEIYVKRGTSSASSLMPSGKRWLMAGDTYVHTSSVTPSNINYEQLLAYSETAGGTNSNAGISATSLGLSFAGTAGNTGYAQPAFTGTAGTTGSKGSGAAHDHSFTGTEATISTMPPYLAVNVWKRTA